MRYKLLLATLFTLALIGEVWAWADFDYQYRRAITIDPGGASNLTDFQINVTVDTATLISEGKLNSDCSDVRFYDDDDVTKLPYYLESGTCNATNTTFWVKLADNGTQIYMYYGNPSAMSESNGSAVFDLFDDFEGTALDTNKWTEFYSVSGQGSITVSNGICRLEPAPSVSNAVAIVSQQTFTAGIIIEMRMKTLEEVTALYTHTGLGSNAIAFSSTDIMADNGYNLRLQDSSSNTIINVVASGTETQLQSGLSYGNPTVWHIQKFIYTENGTIRAFYDNTQIGVDSFNDTYLNTNKQLVISQGEYSAGYGGGYRDIDWVRARKYADPEPVSVIGTEELSPTRVNLIEPDDGATSVSSYINFTGYVVAEDAIVNLTLNVGEYIWLNESAVVNATNYTFENRYLPIGSYTWNMTLCTVTKCVTSPTRTLTVTGANITIELRDEDTDELIVNETAYIQIYNADTLEVVNSTSTTTGEVNITLTAPINYVIAAYTNGSYTNQRRLSFLTSAEASTQNATIYLLKDGRGISQLIRVYDKLTYQPLQGAWVKVYLGGKLVDYALTDTQGRLYSYLDPYKMYSVAAGKTNYQSVNYSITPSTNEFSIYLMPSGIEAPPTVKIKLEPTGDVLSVNETYIPMVTIENYPELSDITFILAKNKDYISYYLLTGKEEAGVVDAESFDLTDLSWCNATWLCTYTNSTISFRYSQSYLNDYGDYVLVRYTYTYRDGSVKTGEKSYMFSSFKLNVAGLFTDEQKPWVGFGIVLFGTFAVISSLIRYGYTPTVRQVGMIAYGMVLLAYKFSFFTKATLIIITMLWFGLMVGGRRL